MLDFFNYMYQQEIPDDVAKTYRTRFVEFREKIKDFAFPDGTKKSSYIFYFIDKIKPIIEDLKKNIKNYTNDQILSKYEKIYENAREWYDFIYAINMVSPSSYDCIKPTAFFDDNSEYYGSVWRSRTVIGDIRDAAERGIKRIKRKNNITSGNIDEVKENAEMQSEQMKAKEDEAQVMNAALKGSGEQTVDEEQQQEQEQTGPVPETVPEEVKEVKEEEAAPTSLQDGEQVKGGKRKSRKLKRIH